jgi:hypothetical protein
MLESCGKSGGTERGAVTNGRSCHNPALPRIGFDRLDFTAIRRDIAPTWPEQILDYERRSDCRPNRRNAPGFRRRAEYRHKTDASAPVLDILYDPAGPFRPRFRLSFRAPADLSKLLDLDVVAPALAFLSHHAQTTLRLSEVELTLDFPPERGSELRQAYVPRARTRHEKGDWWVIGSRKSAFSLRGYEKTVPGLSVARIELVLRRDALRSLGADTLTGLSTLDWPELVSKRLRLVELDRLARCDADEQVELERSLATVGVSASLRALPKARREWLRRHLVPSPIQSEVSELVRSLDTKPDCFTTVSTPASPQGRRLLCIDTPEEHSRSESGSWDRPPPSTSIENRTPQKGCMAA